ncbi:hypothetical protein [Lactiplantibacillus mudanjiangensis]|uniref:Uncharacterized protein n=1 Tax=Lactiplantibacillus mudanjiangensis TaxID=1296538 RepID=A0A660E0G4_9LACO|nr:hypothetical protein [Lactiplantibacillus mudanjiangensis]VDG23151.1 hypothetical protein MUDAN_IGPPGNFN_01784 [Lactiplantibacillus mudanjiangensis]VDG29600.1 hypothetical protein MUDAN_MDHGFNIF_01161 [Lactiplantibacillus mudanjiangensis]VDG32716.1 hypothetical protein MUDAN_DOGOELCO_01976 [Lactiplantibacillus mudanjiangensis]
MKHRMILSVLALAVGGSLAINATTANADTTSNAYQAHLRLRAKPSTSKQRAHAKTTAKTTTKKATTVTYGKLKAADKKKVTIALTNQKQPLTAMTKLNKSTSKIVTYYAYSFKLKNKTKKTVKFYFSNLRFNVYDLTDKTVPTKNLKPAVTSAHITLKAGASKTVKQAVAMNPSAFTNTTKHSRIAFFTYGNLANNKAMIGTVTLGTNTK